MALGMLRICLLKAHCVQYMELQQRRWLNSTISFWFWLISKKRCANPISVSDKSSRSRLCCPMEALLAMVGWGVRWRMVLLRNILWRGQKLLKGLCDFLCWAGGRGGNSHVGASVSHIYGNHRFCRASSHLWFEQYQKQEPVDPCRAQQSRRAVGDNFCSWWFEDDLFFSPCTCGRELACLMPQVNKQLMLEAGAYTWVKVCCCGL